MSDPVHPSTPAGNRTGDRRAPQPPLAPQTTSGAREPKVLCLYLGCTNNPFVLVLHFKIKLF